MYAQKLKRWCQAVRAGTNEMLPTSSTTPATVALVNSEALPAMTAAERSSQLVESKDSATESESDADEEAYVSENDLEITGEQSHTVEETSIA
jgi:hypothetical protein